MIERPPIRKLVLYYGLVPVLFVVSIQLNLSAVALILPIAAVFAYRVREVD